MSSDLRPVETPTVERRLDDVENALAILLRADDPELAASPGTWIVLDARDAAIFALAMLLALAVAIKLGAR